MLEHILKWIRWFFTGLASWLGYVLKRLGILILMVLGAGLLGWVISFCFVVTPYNAQQVVVEEALAAAGFGAVPVGTVDKFQGQEAAVAIVSLAASSGRDAPRGLEFLLLQNRLNVAVSRAEHTAYVVYGTGLLDDLPRTPEGVARLSAFARLVGAA